MPPNDNLEADLSSLAQKLRDIANVLRSAQPSHSDNAKIIEEVQKQVEATLAQLLRERNALN